MPHRSVSDRTAGPGAEKGLALPPFFPGSWASIFAAPPGSEAGTSHGFADMSSKWFEFVTRRLREDMALPPQLSGCRSPVDVWELYFRFYQKLMADYRNEYMDMMRLGSQIATETIAFGNSKNDASQASTPRSRAA